MWQRLIFRVVPLVAWTGLMLAGPLSLVAEAQKTETTTLTIFAAASLENALDDAAKSYETSTGNKVVISIHQSEVPPKAH